jgi:hypothetical protein
MAPAPSKPKHNGEQNEQHPNNNGTTEEVSTERNNNNNNENAAPELCTDNDEDDEFDHIPDEGLRALLYLLRVQGLFAQLFYRFNQLEHQESTNVIPSEIPSTANTIPTQTETIARTDIKKEPNSDKKD